MKQLAIAILIFYAQQAHALTDAEIKENQGTARAQYMINGALGTTWDCVSTHVNGIVLIGQRDPDVSTSAALQYCRQPLTLIMAEVCKWHIECGHEDFGAKIDGTIVNYARRILYSHGIR